LIVHEEVLLVRHKDRRQDQRVAELNFFVID